ncbi:hypothetical protein KKF91_06735, partial [Myxococcota bacterium]|nr:hypothetical protein [Myxococcota bacterium]
MSGIAQSRAQSRAEICAEICAEIRAKLYAGARDAALEALLAAWPRRPERAEILPWASLAQEAGRADLALALLREGLTAHPDAPDLRAEHLALLEDLGPEAEIQAISSTKPTAPPATPPAATSAKPATPPAAWATLPDAPPDAPSSPPAPRDPLLDPPRADVVRLLHLFAGREGVYARQWADARGTGYSPVRAPLTPELWRAHLAGGVTLGAYVVRVDQTATFFALDLDIRRKALEEARGRPARIDDLRARVARAGLDLRAQALDLGL